MVLTADASDEERQARLAAMLEDALDPAVVGDMALDAILNDDAYIFTHPNFVEATEGRNAQIKEAFERWAAYRESHGV